MACLGRQQPRLPWRSLLAGVGRKSEPKRVTSAEAPASTGRVRLPGDYMEPTNWTCSYCSHAQVVTEKTYVKIDLPIRNDLSKYGKIGARITLTVCSNPDCKEINLGFSLHRTALGPDLKTYLTNDVSHDWSLLPESSAKPQPAYISKAIVENYNQACRIRDLSPNASAAMSRRCLQGMIRDFCGITKPTLGKEIETLRGRFERG